MPGQSCLLKSAESRLHCARTTNWCSPHAPKPHISRRSVVDCRRRSFMSGLAASPWVPPLIGTATSGVSALSAPGLRTYPSRRRLRLLSNALAGASNAFLTWASPAFIDCLPRRAGSARAECLIVAAGMEGALPGVVSGLGQQTCHRRPDQRRVWGEFRWSGGAPGHAELLWQRSDGCQHRQRVRCCMRG